MNLKTFIKSSHSLEIEFNEYVMLIYNKTQHSVVSYNGHIITCHAKLYYMRHHTSLIKIVEMYGIHQVA